MLRLAVFFFFAAAVVASSEALAHGTTYYSGSSSYGTTSAARPAYSRYFIPYRKSGRQSAHRRRHLHQHHHHKTDYQTAERTDADIGESQWWNRYFPGTQVLDEREIFPEWFEVNDPDQCDDVPETVNTGRPRDLCGDDDLNVRFCICLKRPRGYALTTSPGYGGTVSSSASVYEPICGECRDPCSLRFIPDRFPRRNRDDDDDDDDYDDDDRDDNGRRRNRNRGRDRDRDYN